MTAPVSHLRSALERDGYPLPPEPRLVGVDLAFAPDMTAFVVRLRTGLARVAIMELRRLRRRGL